MLPIGPDLKKLHECHVVPMLRMTMNAGYREDEGMDQRHELLHPSVCEARPYESFHNKLGLTTDEDGKTVLIDQADK